MSNLILVNPINPTVPKPKREISKLRALLRKECKAGNCEARVVYHDYYDSCHPPTETPNADWLKVAYVENAISQYRGEGIIEVHKRDLTAKDHAPWITQLNETTFELSTGHHRKQIRIVRGAK